MNSSGIKEVKKIFLNSKICFEVYRIHFNRKKIVKKSQNSESQHGWRGRGSGQVGQKPTLKNKQFP